MSTKSLNLLAIVIFSITVLSLCGPLLHLSPTIPALTTAGLLGMVTIDTLAWSGQGTTLVVDWFAQRSPSYRDRILHHEAGHFLLAALLGIPVAGYALSAWEAFQQGQQGRGGLRFEDETLQAELATGQLSESTIDRYCQVWLGGAAAEQIVFGSVEGAGDDRQKVQWLLSQCRYTSQERKSKETWAALQAKGKIEQHRQVYDRLVERLRAKASIASCQQVLQEVLEGNDRGDNSTFGRTPLKS
jgi:hypothetical protein